MSAYSIQGKDCVFQLKIGDFYQDVVCAKNFSLTIATEMKDTTTIGGLGTGWWKEKRPRKLEYSISFNAAVQVVADDDKPTIKTMLQNQVWFLPMDYQIIYRDESDNVLVIRGRVYNANTVITASPSDLLDGTVELQGTGAIEMLDEVPTPITIRLTSSGPSGTENAKFRFRLLDGTGSVVWQTDDLLESTNGYLVHPFDFTTTIIAGEYYYEWDGETETENNVFFVTTVPSHNRIFGDGVVNGTSYPDTILDFNEEREVSWGLGPVVQPPPCVPAEVPGGINLPDGQVGQPYSYSAPITGSAPFNLSNITKPLWMSIAVQEASPGSGTYVVVFSGTPDVVGTDIEITVDVGNSCGAHSLNDTIDIAAAPITQSTINWAFDESGVGAQGAFRLYVNGVEVLFRDSDGSGSINVNFGDTIFAAVACAPGQTCGLAIEDETTSDVLYFNPGPTPGTSKSFEWVAENGHVYDVIADVFN